MNKLTGTTLAAFRLPISLDRLETIPAFMAHVYGTGEYLLRFDGDSLQIVAPADLMLGPASRAPSLPPRVDGDDVELTLVHAQQDGAALQMTFESAQEIAGTLAQALSAYFQGAGGVNFVEAAFLPHGDADDPMILTVQRKNGKTPATLLNEAKERIAELEAQA